jgi:hypothetical protein
MAFNSEDATLAEDEGCEQDTSVYRSLYYLLSALQDAEVRLSARCALCGCSRWTGRLVLRLRLAPGTAAPVCRTPQLPTHPATHLHRSTGLLQAPSISLLEAGAEAALEQQLQPVKWDLCFSPARFASWERLAAGYHEAADGLLVSQPGYPLLPCLLDGDARPVLGCHLPCPALPRGLGLPAQCCK